MTQICCISDAVVFLTSITCLHFKHVLILAVLIVVRVISTLELWLLECIVIHRKINIQTPKYN